MNIKMLQVIGRRLPPILAVGSNIVRVRNRRWLAVLGAGRTIEIVTIQPYSCSVQHLPSVNLVHFLGSIWEMKIQIRSTPKNEFMKGASNTKYRLTESRDQGKANSVGLPNVSLEPGID